MASISATTPLEHYALIGDGESAALVSRSGSIDWMCWPRFDSDACFAALLGKGENGCWTLAPEDAEAVTAQHRYRPDTLIVEREFAAEYGEVRVVDFMTMRDGAPALIRMAQGLRGTVPMKMLLSLRFSYGSVPPWIEMDRHRVVARLGPDVMVLYADVSLERDRHDVSAGFALHEGEHRSFVLRFGAAREEPPPPLDPRQSLAKTESFWRSWIGQFKKATEWPDLVRRSLITLKALTSCTTGGIIAAPTTSLPEKPGGEMNWDYRYCWIRDAAFTISALINAGFDAEAVAWRDWLLRAIAGAPEHVQPVYRIDGGRHLHEWSVPNLAGYRWSRPVRIGNSVAEQKQIDIYGELMDTMDLARQTGIRMTPQVATVEQAIVEHIEAAWREPGHGIWEQRDELRHYVYAKVMAWVAVDRFLKGNRDTESLDAHWMRRMEQLRKDIHFEVCTAGFHTGLNSFTQYYGGQEADASLLLIPLVGFLPIQDGRVASTIDRIERELMESGLVYRSLRSASKSQSAFLACSCWLADCRRLQGRIEAARTALERLLGVGSSLGLFSEQYNIPGKHLSGNFPQALTHLAIVTSALGLSGPALQRGG